MLPSKVSDDYEVFHGYFDDAFFSIIVWEHRRDFWWMLFKYKRDFREYSAEIEILEWPNKDKKTRFSPDIINKVSFGVLVLCATLESLNRCLFLHVSYMLVLTKLRLTKHSSIINTVDITNFNYFTISEPNTDQYSTWVWKKWSLFLGSSCNIFP